MSHSIENRYLGGLRTHSTHLKSSDTIITDAPVDNNGKGNACLLYTSDAADDL